MHMRERERENWLDKEIVILWEKSQEENIRKKLRDERRRNS